jgi:hypothetical protein
MEHRWGTRVSLDIPMRWARINSFVVSIGRLVNLSPSGALITPHFDLHLRSRIQLLLEWPLRPKHPILPITAYVARKSSAGVGLEWCDYAPYAVMQLLRDLSAISRADRAEELPLARRKRVIGQ